MKIELPLDGPGVERVRGASNVLLKSAYLAEILLVMAQEEAFYHGQVLASVPGAGQSFVTSVLTRYAERDMIRHAPAQPGTTRQFYEKSHPDDPLWDFLPSWVEFLMRDPGTPVARLATA